MAPSSLGSNTPTTLLRTLIRANHILHHHGAVDAFGHVSVRQPDDPEQYLMSGYMAPALVSKPEHLITYNISDSSPVDPASPKGYSERSIHGELLKRYSGINCVIHSHAPSVLPFSVAGVDKDAGGDKCPRLKPVFHMAGFLGAKGAPVWDIEKCYQADQDADLLVKSTELGRSLASAFSNSPESTQAFPDHTVVVMRHHGFTTCGPDIQTAMYRTIYTIANARAQLEALALHQSAGISPMSQGSFALEGKVARDTRAMNERTQDKAWPLWLREVEVNPLYQLEI
ncbi:MAG: hypothetical protein Q9159_005902 [Coniocarpon cinnabarinum]